MKDQTFNYAAFIFIIVILFTIGFKLKRQEQSCTNLTAQIDEVQRTQGNHAQWIVENKDGLIALNAEFVGDGSEGYYDFEVEDSYGIDEIPTIP